MKNCASVSELHAVLGTPINPNKLIYIRKHKQSLGAKSAETGRVIFILTNHNKIWLNREIFPMAKSKDYAPLKKAICERFPELKIKLQGQNIEFCRSNIGDQRFEWSQK